MTPANYDLYGELENFFFPILTQQTGVPNTITGIKIAQIPFGSGSSLNLSWQFLIETGGGEQTYNVVTPSTDNMTAYLSPEGSVSGDTVTLSGVLARERGPIAALDSKLEANDIVRMALDASDVIKLEQILNNGKGMTLALKRL